jgi:hypothetical protein
MSKHQRIPLERLSEFNPAEKNKVRFGFVFDTAIYAAAGQDNLVLLSVPEGGQLNDNSRAKTMEDTNLQAAGSLPQNQAMLVKGVQLLFLPSGAIGHAETDATCTAAKLLANDVAAFYNYGLLHLALKGVDIIKDGPLSLYPPQSHIEGSAAMVNTDTDNNRTIELINCKGHPYPIEPFAWRGGEVITAKLLWPNGKVALPSGLTGRVKIRLYGDIYEIK